MGSIHCPLTCRGCRHCARDAPILGSLPEALHEVGAAPRGDSVEAVNTVADMPIRADQFDRQLQRLGQPFDHRRRDTGQALDEVLRIMGSGRATEVGG